MYVTAELQCCTRTTIHPVLRNMTTPKMFSIHDVKTPVNGQKMNNIMLKHPPL